MAGQRPIYSTEILDKGFDHLPLPGGRSVKGVSREELARVLIKLGVPGVSLAAGKDVNAKLYAEHLARITEKAGAEAVEAQFNEKGAA